MRGNRSQLTLIIIFALVIFIIISVLLFLSTGATKKEIDQQRTITQTESAEVEPIKEFIQQCLDRTSLDGLRLLGLQGGYLFQSQGGPMPDFLPAHEGHAYVEVQDLPVAYGIHLPRFTLPPFSLSPPQYPFEGFPLKGGVETFEGAYGLSTLPPLTPGEGPSSLVFQLEQYITTNMKTCLDFSLFVEQGYIFDSPNSSTVIELGEEELFVTYHAPFTLTNEITREGFNFDSFSSSHQVRLSQFYAYIDRTLNAEVEFINHTLEHSSEGDFSLSVRPDIFESDDLLIFSDSGSDLVGQAYDFQVMRHNRAPALYELDRSLVTLPLGITLTPELLKNHFGVGNGSEFTALDPDEDVLSFSYIVQSRVGQPPLPQDLTTQDAIVRIIVEDQEGKQDWQDIPIKGESP